MSVNSVAAWLHMSLCECVSMHFRPCYGCTGSIHWVTISADADHEKLNKYWPRMTDPQFSTTTD